MTWSIPAHDQIGFCARCTSAICQPGLGIDQDTMDMARHNLQVLGTEENSSEIHFLDFVGLLWASRESHGQTPNLDGSANM